jgi:hypothetical protein
LKQVSLQRIVGKTLFHNSQVVVASYLPQVLMQELVVAIPQQHIVAIPLIPQVLM